MEKCPENFELENDLTLCNLFYDLVIREEKRLLGQDIAEDYRLCKALASCYELQDYLATRIALLGAEG